MDVFTDKLKALDEKFNLNKINSEISPLKSKSENKTKKKIKKADNMCKILTTELADLVHAKKNEVIKYDHILNRLWQYIYTHKIILPENKRMLIPDHKMSSVFGKNRISRKSIKNTLIKTHILQIL